MSLLDLLLGLERREKKMCLFTNENKTKCITTDKKYNSIPGISINGYRFEIVDRFRLFGFNSDNKKTLKVRSDQQ